jgi:hypothetical protein
MHSSGRPSRVRSLQLAICACRGHDTEPVGQLTAGCLVRGHNP